MNALLQGFLVSGGLIVAIGAQNAFVLKQGLKRWRVLPIVLTCFLCDFLLMTLGVFGLGTLIGESRVASVALAFIGALFLAVYGARAFRSAWRGGAVMDLGTHEAGGSARQAVLLTLAITLLNPHGRYALARRQGALSLRGGRGLGAVVFRFGLWRAFAVAALSPPADLAPA